MKVFAPLLQNLLRHEEKLGGEQKNSPLQTRPRVMCVTCHEMGFGDRHCILTLFETIDKRDVRLDRP